MLLNKGLIKELRINQGWTQAQLAEFCSVSIRTIQRVEKDGIASLETSMSIASVLNKRMQELFDTPQKPTKQKNLGLLYVFLCLALGFCIGLLF